MMTKTKTKAEEEDRFENGAQKYAAYLETAEGRLRLDLAWANLQDLLPSMASGNDLTALDVGGGTGALALRLASQGLKVTVLDTSEAMLARAAAAATQAGLSRRICILQGDISDLSGLLQPASFDVIVCHNLLEYVADCKTTLRSIRELIHPDGGILSILVRNRAGEVLKAAIKSGDLDLALKNLTAEVVVESLYQGEARLFDPADLRDSLARESLETFAARGVRVLADYLPAQCFHNDAAYAQVLAFERKLGLIPEFAAIARYTQLFAKPLITK